MLTERDAAKIAAEKSLEIFTMEEIRNMCLCNGQNGGIYVLGLGEAYDAVDGKTQPDIPDIDETVPWKRYTKISVDMTTGLVSVIEKSDATIFD